MGPFLKFLIPDTFLRKNLIDIARERTHNLTSNNFDTQNRGPFWPLRPYKDGNFVKKKVGLKALRHNVKLTPCFRITTRAVGCSENQGGGG